MNPINNLWNSIKGVWSRYGGVGWLSKFRLLLPGSRFDYEREAGDLWSNSVLAIAIKWLGDRFAKPRLYVSKVEANGDHTPLGRHKLVDLWNRPNEFYTRRSLERAIGLSLVCDGNAYVQIVRSNSREPIELWWLPHFFVSPIYPDDGSRHLSAWSVVVDGTEYRLDPRDVIHVRDGIDPRNERKGLSAVAAQFREVCSINEESGHIASVLRNSGVPGLMIVPDDERMRINADDAVSIKKAIGDGFTGENRGQSIVLGGKFKVIEIGYSPEQLRIEKLTQTAMAKLGAAAGVPLMAMGLPDPGKTYSNLAEALRIGWGAIEAIHDLISEALRWNLLAEWSDPASFVIEYDYSQILELQEDLAARSARLCQEVAQGVRTTDEAREELGLDTDEDDEAKAKPVPSAAMQGDVQATALNGAQIASLVQLVQGVAADQLPPDSARAIIAASFPSLDAEQVNDIVAPAESFHPAAPLTPLGDDGATADGDESGVKGKMAASFRAQRRSRAGAGARQHVWYSDGHADQL